MTKIVIILLMCTIAGLAIAQTENPKGMKVNAGIVTPNISKTKEFYTRVLNFGVTFENEFYLLLHSPDHQAGLSFLLPNHPSQNALFQKPFQGQGMYLTLRWKTWIKSMQGSGLSMCPLHSS